MRIDGDVKPAIPLLRSAQKLTNDPVVRAQAGISLGGCLAAQREFPAAIKQMQAVANMPNAPSSYRDRARDAVAELKSMSAGSR